MGFFEGVLDVLSEAVVEVVLAGVVAGPVVESAGGGVGKVEPSDAMTLAAA